MIIDIGGEKYARLKKSLYGLRQAAHDWFNLQERFIMEFDSTFQKSKSEPCMYTSKVGDRVCVILVYVDDYLVESFDEILNSSRLHEFLDFAERRAACGCGRNWRGGKFTQWWSILR